MIERIDTGTRMSKIVKHNGVAYLFGQMGDGTTVADQTRDCLSRVDALLAKAGSSRGNHRTRNSRSIFCSSCACSIRIGHIGWAGTSHEPQLARMAGLGRSRRSTQAVGSGHSLQVRDLLAQSVEADILASSKARFSFQ